MWSDEKSLGILKRVSDYFSTLHVLDYVAGGIFKIEFKCFMEISQGYLAALTETRYIYVQALRYEKIAFLPDDVRKLKGFHRSVFSQNESSEVGRLFKN